jgi:hypothetical protein
MHNCSPSDASSCCGPLLAVGPPSRASLSPSACLDPCAPPNPLRARLLACLDPHAHDGLTLTATLLLCKMLTNPGLAQSNLLARTPSLPIPSLPFEKNLSPAL